MAIPDRFLTLAQEIADRFRVYEEIEAVAIAGSMAGGYTTEDSDLDLYLYFSRPLTFSQREVMTAPYASRWQHVDYWGAADIFFDAKSGIEVEAMLFHTVWMQDQVNRVLDDHAPSMGFSTAFWYTIRQSHLIYDRSGWLTALHAKAQQPYPVALAHNIVMHNYPLFSGIIPSYRRQIKTALSRHDLGIVTHKLAALMASYFDILFAVNHVPHPGEKRQIEKAQWMCKTLPEDMAADVTRVHQRAGDLEADLLGAIDTLIAHLTTWLQREGYSVG